MSQRRLGVDTGIVPYTAPYWHVRRGPKGKRINASEASVAANANKHITVRSLLNHIKMERTLPANQLTELCIPDERTSDTFARGHRMEKRMLEFYAHATGRTVIPGTYWIDSDEPDELGATPDATVRRLDDPDKPEYIIECKHTSILSTMNYVDEEHVCQIMHQLKVTGLPWCDYIKVYVPEGTKPEDEDKIELLYSVVRVYWSHKFFVWLRTRYQWLYRCLDKEDECNTKEPTYLFDGGKPAGMLCILIMENVKRDKEIEKEIFKYL